MSQPQKIDGRRARRVMAMKKAKQKKMITIAVFCVIGLIIIGSIAFFIYRQGTRRVFADDNQTVTLHDNGSFTASLVHGTISGTYTENTEGGITTVTFAAGGLTANGIIANNVLSLPDEWKDDHGHGTELRMR